jgi:hypothetical protein
MQVCRDGADEDEASVFSIAHTLWTR